MGREHSKVNLSRRAIPAKAVGKFILFVEGRNTEESYFKLLKKTCCAIIPVVEKGHGVSSCIDFVNEAVKKFNNFNAATKRKYIQRWLVLDYDGHKDFSQAVKLARASGFKVAFSSMCFEYWLDLHFVDHDGRAIPMQGNSHSRAQIDILNNGIRKYNKSSKGQVNLYDDKSKIVEQDLFDLMLSINPVTKRRRIVDAYVRAETIHNKKVRCGCEFNESVTTVYELLRELGVISVKNGEYSVNL